MWHKDNQHRIQKKCDYLCLIYPNVTWGKAQELYEDAVNEVLSAFNVELLIDVPFGRAYNEVKCRFEAKLKEESNDRFL